MAINGLQKAWKMVTEETDEWSTHVLTFVCYNRYSRQYRGKGSQGPGLHRAYVLYKVHRDSQWGLGLQENNKHLASSVGELPGVSNDVCQGTTFQELHDHPELIAHQIAVVHIDHIVMVVVPHDHNLDA